MHPNRSLMRLIICAAAALVLCASFAYGAILDSGLFPRQNRHVIEIEITVPQTYVSYGWVGTAEVYVPILNQIIVIPGKGHVNAHTRPEARQMAADEMNRQGTALGKVISVEVELTGDN